MLVLLLFDKAAKHPLGNEPKGSSEVDVKHFIDIETFCPPIYKYTDF